VNPSVDAGMSSQFIVAENFPSDAPRRRAKILAFAL